MMNPDRQSPRCLRTALEVMTRAFDDNTNVVFPCYLVSSESWNLDMSKPTEF